MRRLGLAIVIVSVLALSGCDYLGSSTREKDVEEYNKLATETVSNYTNAKMFADKNKGDFLKYVKGESEWEMYSDLSELSEEEKRSFEITMVWQDKYYTALGSTGVREVVILNGTDHTMYVNIIWTDGKVVSVERVVQSHA